MLSINKGRTIKRVLADQRFPPHSLLINPFPHQERWFLELGGGGLIQSGRRELNHPLLHNHSSTEVYRQMGRCCPLRIFCLHCSHDFKNPISRDEKDWMKWMWKKAHICLLLIVDWIRAIKYYTDCIWKASNLIQRECPWLHTVPAGL